MVMFEYWVSKLQNNGIIKKKNELSMMDICNANVIYFSINSQFSLKLIFWKQTNLPRKWRFCSFTIPIYFICALDHFKFHHQWWKALEKIIHGQLQWKWTYFHMVPYGACLDWNSNPSTGLKFQLSFEVGSLFVFICLYFKLSFVIFPQF